jgi:uncharacterized protein YjbI with pentapeptide repeats
MADKLDPFDVEALQSAVNDSATRVSAIWISFLIFSLYLLIAATTVTQRQLLLADPIKLPVLDIELPLWGFFFLAPILFVILHSYVLLQVLLLGRTTAAYNSAVARLGLSCEENISVRQRLANTLFAQIFAGSPREREGFIGWLLRAIVWITLAIAPILIVLAFQFSFLAYHSHIATWTHRLLILIELAAFFLIWPLALDAQKVFQWPKVGVDLKHLAALSWSLLGPYEPWHTAWPWLRQRPAPFAACLLFIIVSLSIATFPGEPHVNLATGHWPLSVQCDRLLQRQFPFADLRFDRLILPGIDVVDKEKLSKIEGATSERGLNPWQGERTQYFGNRNITCGDLTNSDLRRVDLTGARMSSADLTRADLQGASLDMAQLQGVIFDKAQLQVSSFSKAELQGASLDAAHLEGASLAGANLHGADLGFARLTGASLLNAQLQGAGIDSAHLEGADLTGAHLQGATFEQSQLQGALFYNAMLQGADFFKSDLSHTDFSRVYVWSASDAVCSDSRVVGHIPKAIVDITKQNDGKDGRDVQAAPLEISKFIERSVDDIPNKGIRDSTRTELQSRLLGSASNTDAIEAVWSHCEETSKDRPSTDFNTGLERYLQDLVCKSIDNTDAIARGIILNRSSFHPGFQIFLAQLASDLLQDDEKNCPAIKHVNTDTMSKLRTAAALVVPASASSGQPSKSSLPPATAPVPGPVQTPGPSPITSNH